MLVALQRDGWITQEARDELSHAYQLPAHRRASPADDRRRADAAPALGRRRTSKRFARFCGYADLDSFSQRADRTGAELVEKHYARLFEDAPGLDSESGSLVFTGTTDDPETLATLQPHGLHDPARGAETVRGWHFGRRAAVQSARAREVLTELVPRAARALSPARPIPTPRSPPSTGRSARMPAAVELFSILQVATPRCANSSPIFSAPRRASPTSSRSARMCSTPSSIPTLLRAQPRRSRLRRTHRRQLVDRAGSDRGVSRRHPRDRQGGDVPHRRARALRRARSGCAPGPPIRRSRALSCAPASAHVERVLRGRSRARAGRALRRHRHGQARLPRDDGHVRSRPHPALRFRRTTRPSPTGAGRFTRRQYYTRLTQRLISALTVPTRRGGSTRWTCACVHRDGKGPVATQLGSFRDYQASEAETWEQMALTRARVIAGEASLADDVRDVIAQALRRAARGRSPAARSARDARADRPEKGESDPWDLKLASGGLIDLEFIAQYLMLRHAHARPDVIERLGSRCSLACAAPMAC